MSKEIRAHGGSNSGVLLWKVFGAYFRLNEKPHRLLGREATLHKF
jgi:hypothetical protein